jgi:TPR repeat protein
VNANEELKGKAMAQYYTCCGKSICGGCVYSVALSGNTETCPFCKAKTIGKTVEEEKEELLERVKVNDAGAIYQLGICYYHGKLGLLQDREKAKELWTQAARLGSSQAHYTLGNDYYEVGDLKKARFHLGAAAMAGHETARDDLGYIEIKSNKKELAVRHWMIAASAGSYNAMHNLLLAFEDGVVSRELIDSMLTAYNNSCAEVRSNARDAYIKMCIDLIGEK